jgi:hypothetical protein
MKRRAWMLLAAVTVIGLATLWFEPTGVVRGWLRGETFYDGRPANYWSRQLQGWSPGGPARITGALPDGQVKTKILESWFRPPSLIDRWEARTWQPGDIRTLFPPPLEEPDVRPVLEALLNDPSPQVRQLAATGLALTAPDDGFWK